MKTPALIENKARGHAKNLIYWIAMIYQKRNWGYML
jgi:hypothetical protein